MQQINARGLISVHGRNYYVGRRYAGPASYVRFDAETGEWLFELVGWPRDRSAARRAERGGDD